MEFNYVKYRRFGLPKLMLNWSLIYIYFTLNILLHDIQPFRVDNLLMLHIRNNLKFK